MYLLSNSTLWSKGEQACLSEVTQLGGRDLGLTPVSQGEFFTCMKVASYSLLLIQMPSLWSRWTSPAETNRTLSLCPVPGADGKGSDLRRLAQAAESPGAQTSWFCRGRDRFLGFLGIPHSIAGPVSLRWTGTFSRHPVFTAPLEAVLRTLLKELSCSHSSVFAVDLGRFSDLSTGGL